MRMAAGALVLEPTGRATAEHQRLAGEYSEELALLCAVCDPDVQARVRVFADQYRPYVQTVRVPRFRYFTGVPFEPGVCHSCGASLPAGFRWGACRACGLAWRIVVNAPITEAWLLGELQQGPASGAVGSPDL